MDAKDVERQRLIARWMNLHGWNGAVAGTLGLICWAFAITGPILLIAYTWSEGSDPVLAGGGVTLTVVVVGTLLSWWFLTRAWTFDDAHGEITRLREVLTSHHIDPDTGERITSG